jgi:hypothetical protein
LRADRLLFFAVMGKGRFWIVVEEGWMLDRCVCSSPYVEDEKVQ